MKNALRTISDRPLSKLIFGAMQFGGNADLPTSQRLFSAAHAAGVNHFDTAHGYTEGASEIILGDLVRQERDEFFVATKVGYVGGTGRDAILSQFETSRLRLNLDVVDLLYMHRFDREATLEETFDTLAELQSRGSIRFIGVSNYAAWQVMKAQSVAASLGTRIDVVQPMYSLVKRQAEVELFPMCQDQGILPATYSPLGGGLLTGKYSSGGTGRLTEDSRYAARYRPDWMHTAATELANIARDMGVEASTLAVAWAAKSPFGVHPIISARNVEQLIPSLAAIELDLNDSLYDQLTALTPTPAPATDRLEEA